MTWWTFIHYNNIHFEKAARNENQAGKEKKELKLKIFGATQQIGSRQNGCADIFLKFKPQPIPTFSSKPEWDLSGKPGVCVLIFKSAKCFDISRNVLSPCFGFAWIIFADKSKVKSIPQFILLICLWLLHLQTTEFMKNKSKHNTSATHNKLFEKII